MQISWEHVIDDLASWDDLEHHLGGQWRGLRDRVIGVVLSTQFDELLVDEPVGGTAAQRRALHRRGFRRRGDRCWLWEPPAPSDPPPAPPGLPPFIARAWTHVERDQAVDRARTAMAMDVLREVFRCSVEHLEVYLEDDDVWVEEEEDDWPELDCAELEDRYGPGRSARR